jgi:YhcH/YjgK/YiaL family protein
MVFEAIKNLNKHDLTNEKFKASLKFLQRKDLGELPVGNFELVPGVIVQVQSYSTEPAESLDFETHDFHFDIHYVIEGLEGIGVTDREGLIAKGEYNPSNDMAFWEEPKDSGMLILHPGEYAILAPEDAHKPHCAVGEPCTMRKIVIKVEV